MNYLILGLILCLQFLAGCASNDDAQEASAELPAEETNTEALSFSLTGAWQGYGGASFPFAHVEFLNTLVDRNVFPAAPAGARHFYGRGGPSGSVPEEVFGYYLAGATQITLGRIGAVTVTGSRYLCATASCAGPAVYNTTYLPSSSTMRMTKVNSADSTTLRPQAALTIDTSRRVAVVTPRNPTRVEEFSAYELQRHLQLVLNTNDVPVYTEGTLTGAARVARTAIYVGKTTFARSVGVSEAFLPTEGYSIQTVGKSVVLLGRETGPAVAPGTVSWVSGANALRFGDASTELRYDVAASQSLFAAGGASPGGTLELWLRDESTCTGLCGASVLFNLEPASTLPGSLGVVGYNLAGGATSIGVFIKNASGGAATIPDVAGAYIPRDNNVHHVTLSFAPCVSPPTQICISGWIDNRTVWAAQPIPGTSLDSLNLARDWQQRFVLNRPGAPGWNGALHGLRIANRPSTQAEHQARTIASLAQADSADTFVLDFTEGGGFPKEKVVERAGGARPASGLLPVIWGERGTLHASYEFLDRFFGVRWYMPGNLGLAYTTRTSVSLPLQKLSLALPLRYRFALSPLYLTPLHHLAPDALGEAFDAETRNLWALRMRLGGEDTAYNHAFYDFKANQVQAHPEWFALDANNNRNQACLGNQAFVDKVGAYAQAYAQSTSDAAYFASATDASRDMRTVKNGAFSVSPLDMFVLPRNQDGSLVGTDCNVQSAQAAGLVTTGYPVGQFFSGTASNYVFDFYNRVATAMQSATPAPGRNPRITGLAYMDYAFPPSTVAIHPSVNPVVNFDLKGWGTTNPQATGRAQLTAWNTRMGTAGYYGWTYLIDSVYGLYTPPSFEYGRLATATNEAFGMGIKGLTFEHAYTWDARSPVRDLTDPVLGPIIEDFRNFVTPSGYRKLWEEWPMSLSMMFGAGPGHALVFNCKNQPGENPAESYEPSYSPYCARYNNALPQNHDVFTRLDPLLRASTEARGTPDAQLDSYLLLRRMADPNFDANAAITEFFTLYYGSAGGPLRAFHDLAALIPAVHTITSCNQPSAYEKNKCLWQARVPVAQLNSLNSFMTQARTAVPGPGLSPVQAKRVKAFDRNVWCLFARSYYMFYDNADALRAADPMHLRQACIEDPNLKTYVTSEMRYVVE